MSYFDPHYFNKDNLKKEDKAFLDHAEEVALRTFANTKELFDGIVDDLPVSIHSMIMDVIDSFEEYYKSELGTELQMEVVSIIDNYPEDEDAKFIEEPDTYYYEGEEDEMS